MILGRVLSLHLNSGNVEKDQNGRVKEFIYDEF